MSPSFWPTPQDYNEAIQNPDICIADADLKRGVVEKNALGLPRSMTGAFASVYKLTCDDKDWAVRCFLSNRLAQHERYEQVSRFVLMDDLECTVDFYYLEEGIKIRGEWFPLLKMPWVEGDTLDRYILKNYKNTELMKSLLSDFHKMMGDLECAKVGHGDLQHGNIIVSPDGLRLVDYDALFVPALAGSKSLELGHPNYQHPERNANHYDKDVDNFSAWLIHTAILSIAIDGSLYEKYCDGDDSLLFRRTDLANPEKSELFDALTAHPSEHIREAAKLIKRMLWAAPDHIPILDAPLDQLAGLPESEAAKHVQSDAPEPLSLAQTSTETEVSKPAHMDFSFIDSDAAMMQTTIRKDKPPEGLAAIPGLIRIGWDKFHLWFSALSYVELQMARAQAILDKGDVESARQIYLKLYKVLEETNNTAAEDYFNCLVRLGCCYTASDTPALASNYFLLALQNAGQNSRSAPALYLALARFRSGDHSDAIKLLTEHVKERDDLPQIVKTELTYHLVDRMALFDLLTIFCQESLKNGRMELAEKGALSSWIVLRRLIRTNSVELTEELLDRVLEPLSAVKNSSEINQAYSTAINEAFAEIANYCIDTACSSTSSIACLAAELQTVEQFPDTDEEPLREALRLVAKAHLVTEQQLKLLTTRCLAAASAERVRDIMVNLAMERLSQNSTEGATDMMTIACELTADHELLLSEGMISMLEKLDLYAFLCTERILANSAFFKTLILQLACTNQDQLLSTISKSLAADGKSKHVAQLLTTVKYGCPDSVFQKVCEWIELSRHQTYEVNSLFEKDTDSFAKSLELFL